MGRLLALALALAALAGCTSPASVALPPVPDSDRYPLPELGGPGMFAVAHPGGTLTVALSGPGTQALGAQVTVYGPDDERLGSLVLDAGTPRGVVQASPGELVLHIFALNGTLRLANGAGGAAGAGPDAGAALPLRALSTHYERVLLASQPSAVPWPGLSGAPLAPRELQVELRTPTALAILVSGHARGLEVQATSPRGLVLELPKTNVDGGFPLPLFRSGLSFRDAGADFHAANSSGRLDISIQAEDLEGVVVLESRSYSRAILTPDPAPADAAGLFRYTGAVRNRPAAVEVAEDATVLTFLPEDENPFGPNDDVSVVALFGPDDRLVATVEVSRQGTSVPVGAGGTYVVAPLQGAVIVATDRLLAEGQAFETHPLDTAVSRFPSRAPDGAYATQHETTTYAGIAYKVEATYTDDGLDLFWTCASDTYVALAQDGETVAWATGRASSDLRLAPSLLRGGEVEVAYDGDNDGCARTALAVHGYLRP